MLRIGVVENKPGVYVIKNNVNNKIYIGSSINVLKRFYQHNGICKRKGVDSDGKVSYILHKAFNKYKCEDFTFEVISHVDNYLEIEELLIKLYKPEYNCSIIFNGIGKPNQGKKFDKQWVKKITNNNPHSPESLEKVTKINKENAAKILAKRGSECINFESWREVSAHFNCNINVAHRLSYKDWKFEVVKNQKKKVECTNDGKSYLFNSAGECDRYFNLWRGCTSNAIKNLEGRYGYLFLKYL
jgi:group I intron endonuclease